MLVTINRYVNKFTLGMKGSQHNVLISQREFIKIDCSLLILALGCVFNKFHVWLGS